MKVLFVIVLSVVLTACQSLRSSPPEWWTSPVADSEQWIYGAGEGYDLKQANQQALANIAGKLKTEISSSLSRRTQETNSALDDYVDRQLTSSVATVSLSHYETLNTAVIENKTLTLIRVDRAALAKEWLRQYDAIAGDVQSLLGNQQTSPFLWWLEAKGMIAKARSGDQLAALWSGVMSRAKTSQLESTLHAAIDKRKPSVQLIGDQSGINQIIRSALLEDGLRIGRCRACDVTIKYSTQFGTELLFGQSVVTMTFSGVLTDREGEVSASRWNVRASSMSGPVIGKKATLVMASEKINSEGLWKVFGIETE